MSRTPDPKDPDFLKVDPYVQALRRSWLGPLKKVLVDALSLKEGYDSEECAHWDVLAEGEREAFDECLKALGIEFAERDEVDPTDLDFQFMPNDEIRLVGDLPGTEQRGRVKQIGLDGTEHEGLVLVNWYPDDSDEWHEPGDLELMRRSKP